MLQSTASAQFPHGVSATTAGILSTGGRLLFPSTVLNASTSLFFNSCQEPSSSFHPRHTRRNAANDSSEGAKSAPSTSAIRAVRLSFTVIKLIPFGVYRIDVASPSIAATFLSTAAAATATEPSFGHCINAPS